MTELISGFFALAQGWGPTALTSVLVLVVLHLCRLQNAGRKQLDGIATSLRRDFTAQLKTLSDSIASQMDAHERRISYIEMEYTRNKDFHRELGGWRAEITRLSDQMANFFQHIIEVWKEGAKQNEKK
jgi:hypothetical protein